MRRIFIMILSFLSLFPTMSLAQSDASDALLNRISMRFNAEQWVPTKTAVVTVGINAGVTDAALGNLQEEVLKKLQSLSEGEWHVTSFERSLDAAGLEKVQMSAQARLPSSALPKLRDKAKAMSKPGETYTLDNVQFTPSEDEIRAAQTNLRSNIYAQAKDELDRLNKQYPDQKYYVHEVNFIPQVEVMQPMTVQANVMFRAGVANSGNAMIAVGDKLTVVATVVFASTPDIGALKAAH